MITFKKQQHIAYKGNLELIKYLGEDLGMNLDCTASGGAYEDLNALGKLKNNYLIMVQMASNDEYIKVIEYLKTKP